MRTKKTRLALLIIFIAVAVLALCFAFGCSGDGKKDEDKEFTGITFTDKTVTYDGTEQSIEISGTLPSGTSVSYSNNKGTDAGTYAATATLSGTGYKTTTLNATLTIQKATLDSSAITFSNGTFTYDGTPKSISVSGLPVGATASYTISTSTESSTSSTGNSATDAGEYTVSAVISGSNYTNEVTASATLTIQKASLSGIISFENTSYVYDGTTRTIEITGTLPDGCSVSYSNNTLTEIGTTTATATISGGNNYEDLTLTATLNITDKPTIEGITLTAATYIYDGTAKNLSYSGTLPTGASVSYEISVITDGTAGTPSTGNSATDAGTYSVTATVSCDGYSDLVLTATLTISKAEITGVTFTDATVTYNGEQQSIEISGTLPTGASVSYSNNSGTDAGTYSATAAISGGNNYKDATLTATLTIEKAEITGVTFTAKTVTYDGTQQSIEISGTLPTGASVSYTSNTGTNAGTYSATASISGGTNYKDLELTATLTIEKADITGIELKSKVCLYDNNDDDEKTVQTLEISGDLPDESLTVTYKYYKNDAEDGEYTTDGVTEAGMYTVTVEISGDNYNTLTLEATLRIVDLSSIASSIVNALTENSPDPWSYLPEGLQMEALAYESMPVTDFATSSVSVSSIGIKFIGEQLNEIYTMLSYADTAMYYIDLVNSLGSEIADGFQTYINNNPTDYNSYTATSPIGGFTISVILQDDVYCLLAGNSVVSVEIYYDTGYGYHTGRVQLTDGMALSYTYTDSYLQMDLMLTVNGVGTYYELAFQRTDETTSKGYVYEYLGTANTKVSDSIAFLLSYEDYTFVMSDQGTSVNQYEEIYDSKTGELIGGEVTETKVADYDTYIFNLYDVTGINSILVDASGDFYLNGSSAAFKTKTYGGLSLKTASRRYYIEMETVYYIVKSYDDEGNLTYTKVESEIPMLLVQVEMVDDFPSDIVSQNLGTFSVTPALPTTPISLLSQTFSQMVANYNNVTEAVTVETIVEAIGEKSSLFQTEDADGGTTEDDTSTDGD
ncbi:MAG: MBG domain-containing protein [Clostridia bacterium]|nr:MBG domain-containing protein [Clostridia bacterium]